MRFATRPRRHPARALVPVAPARAGPQHDGDPSRPGLDWSAAVRIRPGPSSAVLEGWGAAHGAVPATPRLPDMIIHVDREAVRLIDPVRL